MNTEKGHLDTLEILEMARKTAEREELRYNIARRVCDMIAGKWHGKKINKRIAADAERVINDDKTGVPGGFDARYDIRYGMFHIEIRYKDVTGLTPKEMREFSMSMLVAFDSTPVIDAAKVEEHNQGHLLGMQRKAEILRKTPIVPQAVIKYNEAVRTLANIEKMFGGIYPLTSYFKFEASKEVKK